MQQIPSYTDGPAGESLTGHSPADSLARHFPWLLGLALIGILLLLSLLAFSTYTVATVLVPDRGGTFREGVAGAPQYLSPIWCNGDDVDRDLCTLIYRGLTRIDKSGRVVPDLAAGWTVDNDTTYTFTLKPDQFWQDGRKVTAADVVFTVGVLQDPSLIDTPGQAAAVAHVQVQQIDLVAQQQADQTPQRGQGAGQLGQRALPGALGQVDQTATAGQLRVQDRAGHGRDAA